MVKNIENYKKIRDVNLNKKDLIDFELDIVKHWENGDIAAPIHLSDGNEEPILDVFSRISYDDHIFSTWRSHYHALCHGISPQWLKNEILEGRSITICNLDHNFYSSAIVGGIIPIALGTAIGLKRKKSKQKVWCFIGDMTFETGVFHESYKYANNFDLPLQFVVEDNNLSVHTPTDTAWGVRQDVPDDVVYYRYENGYPHHGTGAWVNF
jgi:pyruvate dehydrogenase E1 component alpha subunit